MTGAGLARGGSPQRTPRARRGGKVARVGGPRKDTVGHGRGVFWGGGCCARGFTTKDRRNEVFLRGWRASFGPRNNRNLRKGRRVPERLMVDGWWLVVGGWWEIGKGLENRTRTCTRNRTRARLATDSEFGWHVRFSHDRGGQAICGRRS